jgi:hypothetical protein
MSEAGRNRRNAADYVAAGGALLGASAAADGLVALDRQKRKMDGPIRSAVKRKFTRRHAGQVGVKIAGRAAFAAGAPLAAYGGYKMVKPDKPVPRLDPKRDVAKPLARGVTFKDLADEQERRIAKFDLNQKEKKKLVARKKRGQHISTAAGVMGLGALALRAPEAAKFAAKRSAKAGKNGTLKRLAAKEPNATKASNALGVTSIGVGAAGSLNFAAQQKLEAKGVKKGLYDGFVRGLGRGRVVDRPKKGYVTFLDNSRSVKRFMPESRVTPVKRKKAVKPVVVDKPGPQQMELDFGKADDRFLRRYRSRISPEAERGYKYLKRGRNEGVGQAVVGSTAAGITGAATAFAARDAKRLGLRRGHGRLAAGLTAAGAGITAWNGVTAAQGAKKARSWNGKLKRIEAKAKERESLGQYGRSREVGKSAGRKAEGAAQAAAGGAALGVGLSTNRLVNAAERNAVRFVEERRAKQVSSLGPVRVRTVTGASKNAKERAQTRTRANQARVNEVNRKANAKKKLIARASGAKTRGALITAGFATAAPNVWLGSRKAVEKADQHDVDAFMGGALAGAGAYHGGLYATKRVDRRFERSIANTPDQAKILREHRRAVGLPKNARKGDARWLKYHRQYPKSLPGSKWKRALSYAQGGRSQVAITAGVAGATGLAAAKVNRKKHPVEERRVNKAFKLPTLPRGRLMPKSRFMRKPSVRSSYIGTSVSGKKFSVRGSVR